MTKLLAPSRLQLDARLEDALSEHDALDRVATQLQLLVRGAEHLLPAPIKDVLLGRPLGHPLHPALVHLPLGGWTVVALLDFWPGGDEDRAHAADLALLLSTLAAAPTIGTGWLEWSETRGQARRTGLLHGAAEEGAFFLNLASLLARKRGKRGLGKALSGAALGLALGGGLLGGQLVYRHGVGLHEQRR